MSQSTIRNNVVTPLVTASDPHQAPTNTAHADANNAAPVQASNAAIADPTRLALLQFGTQARARAAQLRGQLIGHAGVMHETYSARVEAAVTEALNAGMPSASIDEQFEKRIVCMAKLREICRFATEQNGQLLYNLLTLPEIPLHDRTPTVERADHKSAEILKSDLRFLEENIDLWINDTEIDEQLRNLCWSLLPAQQERGSVPSQP